MQTKEYQNELRKIQTLVYADTITGEIIELPTNALLVNKKTVGMSSKFYKRTDEPYFFMLLPFFKNLKVEFDLDFNELGKLLVLLSYINYRNEADKKSYIIHKQKVVNSNKQLKAILNISDSATRKIKKKLIDNKILFEDDIGLYFCEQLAFKGKIHTYNKKFDDNKYIYRLLINTIHNISNQFDVTDNKNKYKALGFLFSLLPYIKVTNDDDKSKGYQASYNALVSNKVNIHTKQYASLNKDELAQHLQVSKKTIYEETKRLNQITRKIYDEDLIFELNFSISAIGNKSNTYKTKQWVINPRFTFSSDRQSEQYQSIIEHIKTQKNDLPF